MINLKIVCCGDRYAIRKGFWPFYSYLSIYSNSWFPLRLSYEFCWDIESRILYRYKELKKFENYKIVEVDPTKL